MGNTLKKVLSRTFGIGMIGLVAACGSSADIARDNPNYFGTKIEDGKLLGSYNPAGFDRTLVQSQIKKLCVDKKIGSYGEAPQDGLTAFTATCANGTAYKGGFAEIERLPSGNFSFEGTFY